MILQFELHYHTYKMKGHVFFHTLMSFQTGKQSTELKTELSECQILDEKSK